MADALISIRGDLSDITEKLSKLGGQMKALDSEAAAPMAAAITDRFKGMDVSVDGVGKSMKGLSSQTAAAAGEVTDRFKSVGVAVGGVGVAMAAIGGAVASFGLEAAKGAGRTAESLELLRQKTGLTTDELRQMTPLFNRFNTDLGALTGPFVILSKNLEQAANGSEKAQAKFTALGIAISASDRPIDVLGKIADAAQRLGPGFERNAAMAELMGRGIGALAPILAEGSAGMAQSAADAQRMGLMLDTVAVENLNRMDDAIDDVGTSMKALHDTIGTAFAPVLLQLAQSLTSVLGSFNRWFQGLDAGTKQLAVVFVGTFALGGPILIAVGAFMAALAVITAPMLVAGAIVAGVVAGVTLIILNWDKLKSLGTAIWNGLTVTIVGSARAIHDGIMEWLVNKTADIAAKVQVVATAIAKPFEWLADHLVGHSVIPDMVDDIGRHMQLLDTRMGSPARIATSNTLRAFREMELSVGQIVGELASVTISTWGNVTNTISGALAQNLISGNNWAQTWQSIQNIVLQGFINLGLQMITQGAITLAKKLLFDTTEATAHEAMEGAKTTATGVGEGARLAMATVTNKAMGASMLAQLAAVSALASGMVALMGAVIGSVVAMMGAIASALVAGVVTAPLAIPVTIAAIGLAIAGGAAMTAAEAAIAAGSAGAAGAILGSMAVPALASGGLVMGPTLALIGESGPEMVVPLDRAGGVGGGGQTTIVIQLDGRELARSAIKHIPGIVRMKTGAA